LAPAEISYLRMMLERLAKNPTKNATPPTLPNPPQRYPVNTYATAHL
jgi:hypothetical protein